MKKILVLFLFVCAHTTFAQEKTKNLTIKTTDNNIRYDPHTLGISFRMGTVIDALGSYGVHNTIFEFYTQGRIGKTKYTPMIALRFSSPIGGVNPHNYGGFRWGVLFGGSQYVFDKRSEQTGLGWSMLVNGGVSADMPSVKEFIDVAKYPITLGTELEFKAIYNVHKYVGISFGLQMGYAFGFTAEKIFNDALAGGAVDVSTIEYKHSFVIGFNFGIIF